MQVFESGLERARKRRRSNETIMKNGEKEKEINIQVVVRCRGRIDREIAANSPVIIKTTPREIYVRQPPADKAYTFDRVYGPDADQARIFDHIVIPILHEVKAGYNCTLFAYGQTSTGKTYTMEGDLNTIDGLISKEAGIIPRTLFSLFRDLEADAQDFSVKVSYIELYNEDLKDLLSSVDDPRKLKIQDEGTKKGILTGHEEVLVKNANDGIRVLKQGSIKRHASQTNYNKNSSRSHSVFSITVHIKETMPDGEDLLKVGKLNLVDLAGSECIGRSGAENNRAKEAGNINKSLLTLGRCINALNERCLHIPFRESKLTRLLQDSLGGKTKTCIIATISPAKISYDETISTLDYAHRAKNIRNKPVANQRVTKKALIKEYISEIERLKMDLLATREKNGCFMTNESYQALMDENQSRKDEIEELRKVNESLMVQVQELRKDQVMLESLRNELANQYTKMQVYQAKIDDQISSLVTETEGHVNSQNQAISACQNIVKEKTDKEVRCLKEHKVMLNKIIEEENSKSIKMKEELLTNISKYLNNFTNVQTASLKNSFGKVYDSIKENVDSIELCREANITALEGMMTSNTRYFNDLKEIAFKTGQKKLVDSQQNFQLKR
ncbi:unnamed protein product [Rhizophagus irregularis]|uniref:Kinesin-like protein n=1 Tax=Rhizophagus irregularis TaxID=588596 RepID=A0A915Z3Y1_9GLOM|nr:unnamed protein product [Rhizophagus irregularis]CAB5211469.1 unnamed protein product [Rhizophagus irregularis]CAB5360572.1 unnamed protein product [Rhizophagus irregularis]CAB5362843.1 unnamed protein product [Rhizophagus irregularis]